MDYYKYYVIEPTSTSRKMRELPEAPVLVVGNLYGNSKPKSIEGYLRPLVNELNELLQNGIEIADKLIAIRVRARAFIKEGFPTSGCLHQIDFGITRIFLNGLKAGKLAWLPKWSPETISRVNNLLKNVEIPSEFLRKFRSIADTGLWKASEFNMFLHYASFIVFKGILTEVQYNHFMLYYCAVTLFSSNAYRDHWPEADRMLRQYVIEYGVLYGVQRLTSNVHGLLHVYDDVCEFGHLKSFSSYPFEDKFQHIKYCLRNDHKVLVQAANRISEQHPSVSRLPVFPRVEQKSKGTVLHINSNIALLLWKDPLSLLKRSWMLQLTGSMRLRVVAATLAVLLAHPERQCSSEHQPTRPMSQRAAAAPSAVLLAQPERRYWRCSEPSVDSKLNADVW
uniref:Uncharacterized protein n=1 Tax=Anopheles minimus TaxID=112268 RepID=A0A182W6B0_9DIPT